jgi:hypothetical protein
LASKVASKHVFLECIPLIFNIIAWFDPNQKPVVCPAQVNGSLWRNDMEYTVEFDPNTGVYTIVITGPHRRPDDSHELLPVAAAAAEEYGCSRFLFDMREARITGGTIATFDTADEPERHGFNRHYRIAALYQTITKDHRFMEDVGVNRGATAFRVFDDIDKAREWIAS